MGANMLTMWVKGDDEAVRKAFKQRHIQDSHYYGTNRYSGSFSTFSGVSIVNKEFNSEAEAQSYLEDHQQKWEDALAVKFKNYKITRAMLNKLDAIFEMHKEIREARDAIYAANTAKRGTTRLENHHAKLKARRLKLEEQLALMRKKKADTIKRTMWLVGGWAAS